MKTIVILLTLLFGFNCYAMQERLQSPNIEYKTLCYKSDTITPKTETKPVAKKKSTFKRVFQIFQLVVLLFVLFLIIALRIK